MPYTVSALGQPLTLSYCRFLKESDPIKWMDPAAFPARPDWGHGQTQKRKGQLSHSCTEGTDFLAVGPDLLSQAVGLISVWRGIPRWWVGSRLAVPPLRPSTRHLRFGVHIRARRLGACRGFVEALGGSNE